MRLQQQRLNDCIHGIKLSHPRRGFKGGLIMEELITGMYSPYNVFTLVFQFFFD